MTLGHLAVGFAAKSLAPRVNLAVLLIASQTIDLLYNLLGLKNQWLIDHGHTVLSWP